MGILWKCIPQTVANRAAIRTAIGVLIAVLLAFKFHLEAPFWSGMTVVVVSNLYTGSIVDKALMRVAGTWVGAWLGYFLSGLVVTSFYLYVFTCFLIIAIAVYFYNVSRYAYSYILGGITAFLVISQVAVDPSNAFYIAVWRSTEITLGVIVAAVTAYGIFPNPVRENLCNQMGSIFALFSQQVRSVEQLFSGDERALATLLKNNNALKLELKKTDALVNLMRFEIRAKQHNFTFYKRVLELCYELARKLNYFIISHPSERVPPLNSSRLKKMVTSIEHDLSLLRAALLSFHPSSVHLTATPFFERPLLNGQEFSHDKTAYYRLEHLLQTLYEVMTQLEQLLTIPNQLAQEKKKGTKITSQSTSELIQHSIKGGLSVALAVLLWLISSWPGGINGLVSSGVISIRNNFAEMKRVTLHRMIGCLMGGGIALILLALVVMDLNAFMMITLFFVWGFSYFSFKYPTYAYIGLQANIALVITLAEAGGPPLYIAPPLERLGGIVIGIVSSFLVANLIWRSNLGRELERKVHRLATYLCLNVNKVLSPPSEKIAAYDLSNLLWACRHLFNFIHTVEASKKPRLLDELQSRFEKLELAHAALNYIENSVDRKQAYTSAQELGIRLEACESGIKALCEKSKEKARLALLHQIRTYTLKVEDSLVIGNNDKMNIRAYLQALEQLVQSLAKGPRTSS